MRRALLTLIVALVSAALAGPRCAPERTSARGQTCEGAPDGSPCDDGRACTSNDHCLGAVCLGTPRDEACALGLTPALCFAARPATAPDGEDPYPSFEPRSGETLIDEFSTRLPADQHLVDVYSSTAFCSDASGVGLQAGDHLHGYGIKPTKTRPRQPTFHGAILEIENELGVETLALGRPDRLLVPAGAVAGLGSASGSPRDPPLRAKCYAVVGKARRSGSPKAATDLVVSDALHGFDRKLQLAGPARLCTLELGRLGETPTPRPGYVACYDVRKASPPPKPAVRSLSRDRREHPPHGWKGTGLLVSVRDEFGPSVLETRKPDEVCLPTALHRPDPSDLAGPFSFLVEGGAVNEAMRAIWARGFEAPQTVDAANAAAAVIDVAEQVLEGRRSEAGASLLANLQALDPDDLGSFLSLDALLRLLADDEAILAFLHGLVATPPPSLLRDGDDLTHPNRYVRHFAVGQIASAARRGSPAAHALLPALAAGPDPDAAAIAVRTYLALSADRRLAQRSLGERMPPENRHLLYTD